MSFLVLLALFEGIVYVLAIHVFSNLFNPQNVFTNRTQNSNSLDSDLPNPLTYIYTETDPIETFMQSRKNPILIKQRMKGAIVSCLLTIILSAIYLYKHADLGKKTFLLVAKDLGLLLSNEPKGTIYTLALTFGIFAGPLYVEYLATKNIPIKTMFQEFCSSFTDVVGLRNFVVGPITEELVYRASIVPLLLRTNMSKNQVVFLAPLIFGFAHLHHIMEKRKAKIGWNYAILSSVAQFGYTTVFGWFITHIFITTSNKTPKFTTSFINILLIPISCADSIYACIASHVVCNLMGFPDIKLAMSLSEYKKGKYT
ncbi:hypothetical protein BB559_000193 [Furculomyces boomerangus]|uniref:intramembrane prenyl-peptidase Rce1 n=1 Tax=Furculomyces boomerangus TaxID=61424 RepID=A0A2T9Z5X6_9FUNG|nr:hypothetical protein BB559_000193 [Furculomyces boomerangus]